jgi:PAS domain S-box-containing protein
LSTETISTLAPSQPFRILCVDDEATGLHFRKMVLERRGFSVETATSAPQAVQLFKAGNFDLLITDHLLGRNTSYGMIAEMKRINPHLGVIVLSGMAEIPDAQGVDAVLSKADGTDALLDKVEELMRNTQGRRILGRTARDIEAEKTEALLAALVESSDDAIFAKTLDARFMSWNRASEMMYGYKADEVIGKPVAILLPPDRPNEVEKIMERLRKGEKIEHFETVRRAKDGHLLDVSLTVSPIRDSRGEIVAASTIARDMSAGCDIGA